MQTISKEELLRHRFPKQTLKDKYKIANYILISLVAILVCFRIIFSTQLFLLFFGSQGIALDSSAMTSVGGLVFLINIAMLLLMIWIIKLLIKFDVRSYLLLIYLLIISVSGLLKNLDFISICVITVMFILAAFLKKKLFPDLAFFTIMPKK